MSRRGENTDSIGIQGHTAGGQISHFLPGIERAAIVVEHPTKPTVADSSTLEIWICRLAVVRTKVEIERA